MDQADDFGITPLDVADAETRQLLGLFDTPAFARRGQDLEYALSRLDARCRRERDAMLDMVRVRLRQWAAAAGPDAWPLAFAGPIESLWPLAGADAPAWADRAAPPRRLRAIARDLVASIDRFNRRWPRFVSELDLAPFNRLIDQFNQYYLLEKECVMGSSRLASRFFAPRPRLSAEGLLARYPPLAVPGLRG